jgi:hypothetical protein
MSMSPGTERSIFEIGQNLPRLTRAVENLAKSMEGSSCTKGLGNGEFVQVKISMTTEEWNSLVDCINVRHATLGQLGVNPMYAAFNSAREKILHALGRE